MSAFDPLTTEDLEQAGLAFEHSDDDGGYSKLVFSHFNDEPRTLAAAAVTFLEKWRAFHYSQRKLRLAALNAFLPDWFDLTSPVWIPLRTSSFLTLPREDNASVYSLASSLYRGGLKPTEYGKLLHFVAPFAVVLWDDKWVRASYGLAEGPREFVFYQIALQALIAEVIRIEGERSLENVVTRHHQRTGCEGGLPKILDEAVYHEPTRDKIAHWISDYNPF